VDGRELQIIAVFLFSCEGGLQGWKSCSCLQLTAPFCRIVCSFNITGNLTNATPTNTTGSVNINNAAINCTGGTLTFSGGPALKPYQKAFSGAEALLTPVGDGGWSVSTAHG